MGLLDSFFGTPDQTAALGLLGSGLMAGNPAAAFGQANQFLATAPDRRMKSDLLNLELQRGRLDLNELQRKTQDAEQARQVLADFYKNQGMPQAPSTPALPGQLGSGSFGAMPPPSGQPSIPAAPQGGVTPKAAVWQQYKTLGDQLASRGLVEQAQQYYGLAEKMRPKYGTEPRVMMGPDGKLVNVLVGEDGTTQVLPFGVKPAMKLQDLGGKVVALDENALPNGATFGKTLTPGEIASNQLGWANNAATLRGQNLTDARSRETIALGRVPAGYRQKPDGGLEYIPGGPADPAAAKRAAPTEFQGKSATYGARAKEADRVLQSLDGQYSPGAVNAKTSVEDTPLVGGMLGSAANLVLSPAAQKAEQAQRDFINATLRQESGAAISQSEFENAKKQYFPQPFDSAAVKAQKARNRQLVISGFYNSSKPGAIDEIMGGATSSGGASGGWSIREVK